MSPLDRPLRPHLAAAILVSALGLLALGVRPAWAQQQRPATAPDHGEFMAQYDFHLMAAALASGDTRFAWDAHFGGELDVIDYVKGRTTVVIDYEAILGNQRRAFDLNQGNYTLEAGSSYRVGDLVEVAGVFHHVSRHLGDREKAFAIAWNVLGPRLLRRVAVGQTVVDLDADVGWVTQRAYVDYQWTGNADVAVSRPISSRATAYGRASGHVIGIAADESSRGTQVGGLLEMGVKLAGTAGGIELFVAAEQRIDADPLLFGPERWAMAGFRLVNR